MKAKTKLLLKRSILPTFTLAVGTLVGQFIVNIDNGPAFSRPLSRPIPLDSAHMMFKKFRHQNEGRLVVRPLKSDTSGRLRGFFINREALDVILGQDSCNGIRLIFGKNRSHLNDRRRVYTLVVVGTKLDSVEVMGSGRKLTKELINNEIIWKGNVYDYVDPCPPNCGTFDDGDGD